MGSVTEETSSAFDTLMSQTADESFVTGSQDSSVADAKNIHIKQKLGQMQFGNASVELTSHPVFFSFLALARLGDGPESEQ